MGSVRAEEDVVILEEVDLLEQAKALVGGEGSNIGTAEEVIEARQHGVEIAHAAEVARVHGAAAVIYADFGTADAGADEGWAETKEHVEALGDERAPAERGKAGRIWGRIRTKVKDCGCFRKINIFHSATVQF